MTLIIRGGKTMINYDTYKQNPDPILVEESEILFGEMVKEEYLRDEDYKEILEDLLGKAVEYASIRSKWLLMERQQRISEDDARSKKHDSVIIKFNMLAKYMEMQGWDSSWREKLGNERKRIGDFACYIAYVYGINAR